MTELTQQYLLENPEDELSKHCRGDAWEMIKRAWRFKLGYGSDVVHHIYPGNRRDCWSLFLTVDARSHAWCHQIAQYPVVLCVWIKHRKDEFDRDEAREVLGRDLIGTIDGWLERGDLGDPYYAELATELLGIYDDE